MDTPAAGEPEPLRHSRLGDLQWDQVEQLWFAAVNRTAVRDGRVGVASAADLDAAAGFLDWLASNQEAFRASAAYQAFNHDLIWDEELEEAELAAKLAVQSVTVRQGAIDVCLDADGATTDHLLRARVDGQHRIVGMEL